MFVGKHALRSPTLCAQVRHFSFNPYKTELTGVIAKRRINELSRELLNAVQQRSQAKKMPESEHWHAMRKCKELYLKGNTRELTSVLESYSKSKLNRPAWAQAYTCGVKLSGKDSVSDAQNCLEAYISLHLEGSDREVLLKMSPLPFSAMLDVVASQANHIEAFRFVQDTLFPINMLPNRAMYNTLIRSCDKTGAYDLAIAAVRHMSSSGIKPNSRTLNELLRVWLRQQKPGHNGVPDIIEEMREKYGAKPNGNTVRIALESTHTLRMCRQMIRDLESVGIHVIRVNSRDTIRILLSYHSLPDVYALWNDLQANGDDLDYESYCVLFSYLVKSKRIDRSMDLMQDMRRRWHVPPAGQQCKLIRALAFDGRVDSALGLWERMVDARFGGSPKTLSRDSVDTLFFVLAQTNATRDHMEIGLKYLRERGLRRTHSRSLNRLVHALTVHHEPRAALRACGTIYHVKLDTSERAVRAIIEGSKKKNQLQIVFGGMQIMASAGVPVSMATVSRLVDIMSHLEDGQGSLLSAKALVAKIAPDLLDHVDENLSKAVLETVIGSHVDEVNRLLDMDLCVDMACKKLA